MGIEDDEILWIMGLEGVSIPKCLKKAMLSPV